MALVNQPAILSGAFAAEGDKNTIPANNDGLSGLASIAKGFPPITQVPLAQGGQPPQRQDFNGIFNLFSQFLLYAQNGGVYAYNNTLDYQPPAIIASDNVFYQCVAENGPSTSAGVQPVTNTTYWEKLVPDVAVMQGASGSAAGTSGLVPAPGAGDNNKVLFGDGTFKTLSNQLQRNTAYQYGDIAYSPNLPSWAYLYCVQAGTTAAEEPSFASVNTMGQYITDGTVKWIVDDVRFNIPVGVPFYDTYLHDGCVKLNGATVNRADYIRPAKIATDKNLWTSSPSTEPYKYGNGNGSTTMKLPDYRNRVIQGGDTVAILSAGLPNATGNVGQFRFASEYSPTNNGVFQTNDGSGGGDLYLAEANTIYSSRSNKIAFALSNANSIYGNSTTVQPPALQLIPQIKF